MPGGERGYENPVVRGDCPDPSVCRVGERYYMVSSSFERFPGIPVRASDNLVDWDIVGHCLDRDSQLDLRGRAASRGIFAPTIRWRDGTFYVVSTDVDGIGNFLVTARDPAGPWSDPVRIGLPGYDPSLFFDADGTAYLCASRADGPPAERGIGLAVVEPASGAIREGPRLVCRGSGGRWPEGPRLLRHGGYYHIIMSEGGTEYGHMVTSFRSPSPWGPYEACPRNPVLTARDDPDSPIQCVGHADPVEGADGRWWLACHGARPLGPLLHNLGREALLVALRWTADGWPAVGAPGSEGRAAERCAEGPAGRSPPRARGRGWSEGFAGPGLGPAWSHVRNPERARYAVSSGRLRIEGGGLGLSEGRLSPSFVSRPQGAFACEFAATVEFEPAAEGAEAGVAAYYDDSYHYEAFVARSGAGRAAFLRRRVHDLECLSPPLPLPPGAPVRLAIVADRERYRFLCRAGDGPWAEIGSGLAAGLCSEGTYRMSFSGVRFGLYALRGAATFSACSCEELDGEPAPADRA